MYYINDLLNDYRDKIVILVDLSWVLYRSHYAFKELSNSDGLPTGSYYGLTKTITQLCDNYDRPLILLVDDGNPVQRKELNESYKGNREHTVHFDNKKYTVDCLIQPLYNVYRVYDSLLEADDLIYSISRIKDYNNQFIIYSSDKDMYQSIDSTTKVSNSISRGQLMLIDEYSDKYIDNFKDLAPYQIPYYRAVLGDASDNLPIIRKRFPSKVAYYFAKNMVHKVDDTIVVDKYSIQEELTETQNSNLLEIYKSPVFMNNLKLMKLEPVADIPLVEKDKSHQEVINVISNLELRTYLHWISEY